MSPLWSREVGVICVLLAALVQFAAPAGADVVFPRGKTPHVVANPQTGHEIRVTNRLSAYLGAVLGEKPTVLGALAAVPQGESAIVLVNSRVPAPLDLRVPGKTEEDFALVSGTVFGRQILAATGVSDLGLKRAVQRMIIMSEQRPDALVFPAAELSETPWIANREWTICPWTPRMVSEAADRRMNICLYSAERLGNYVEMFDWFGFSGCQLMETSYTYAFFGAVDKAQEWQRQMAQLVRSNGQDVSIWAWAAYFGDPEAVYKPQPGYTAFEDPKVRATFEKYYDKYAELAPLVDRFIAHYYDPGLLEDRQDVFRYMRLLEKKLKAKNPDIEMAVDFWAGGEEYMHQLVENGFEDYLLLLAPYYEIQPELPPGYREGLHETADKLGLKLGLWGWYLTEYETDQLASMYVNAHMLSEVYRNDMREAHEIQPYVYWSEMEAHHLNNIYSMYSAGQLLWNPERDPDEILREIALGIWGPKNGPAVLEALKLIEDTRTGPSRATYWWTLPTYRVGTPDAASDLRRAGEALAALQAMKPDHGFVPKFPLPFPPGTFVELMLPHLKQIEIYAQFRLDIEALKRAAEAGASKHKLEEMAAKAWKPVPEFTTWVGVFGPKEIRQQKKTMQSLREEYGIEVPSPGWLRKLEASRVLRRLQANQRNSAEPKLFTPMEATFFTYWIETTRRDRFEKLIEDGVVVKTDGSRYQLRDWENWAHRFRKGPGVALESPPAFGAPF